MSVQTELDVNEFLSANKGLVGKVCGQFRTTFVKMHIDPDDAFQEGLIALYQAYLDYDDQRTAKFSTFAFACIRHRVINFIESNTRKLRTPLERKVSLDKVLYWFEGVPITFEDLVGVETDFTTHEVSEFHQVLNEEETQVLELLYEGKSRAEIARAIERTPSRLKNILEKMVYKYAVYLGDKGEWK